MLCYIPLTVFVLSSHAPIYILYMN